jgi:hypothetical protein
MSSTWFYGDYRADENPLAFITNFEAALAQLPHLSESEKCSQFYNRCKSDFDAENWYENLEINTPAAVTSWSTFVLHFRVKWLRASPDSLLETDSVTSAPLDAATSNAIANATTTTATIIPAPANTAAPAIYETPKTPAQYDRVANARHDNTPPTPAPTRSEVKQTTTATTTATATDPNDAITTTEQQYDEGQAVEREEGGRGVEKQEGMDEREPGRQEVDTGERGGTGTTQGEVQDPAPHPTAHAAANARLHEAARFDWAAEVDEAHGLSPAVPSNPTTPTPTPVNPVPGDPAVDPDNAAHTSAAPVNPTPVPISPAPTDPTPVDPTPGDPAVDPDRTVRTGTAPVNSIPAPTSPGPTDPTPINPAPGDPAVDPDRTARTGTAPVDSIPIPVNPRLANPNPITTLQPEPAEPAPAPINPVPGDAIVDPDRIAHTSAAPANSIPVPTSPVPTDPVPVNPVPGDATVDPVRTASANAMPTNPVPVDPAPISLMNPVHIPFASTIPSNTTAIASIDPDPVPMDSTPIAPTLVDPDPGDLSADPTHVTPDSTVPIDPDPIPASSNRACVELALGCGHHLHSCCPTFGVANSFTGQSLIGHLLNTGPCFLHRFLMAISFKFPFLSHLSP